MHRILKNSLCWSGGLYGWKWRGHTTSHCPRTSLEAESTALL